ncbi:MAG: hypothetical protein IJU70_08395 [Lentisphaeria bacterium]|nr:hypothetical protein [Lentisphaeria bacterium]
MCVWSAYTGKKQAAPEVLEAGTAIEGIWGGFYTGIVTMDDQGLHCAKCCGWSKYWKQRFRTEDLPGTTGLFHSRTNSGGNGEWAHPFVGTAGKVAHVGQGSDGVFSDMAPWAELANELAAKGKIFRTADRNIPLKRYPELADGNKVHVAEVTANAVEALFEAGSEPLEAIRRVFERVHEESIGLYIFAGHPGKIFFVNMNQRGAVWFTPEGAYAATSLLAFGLPVVKATEIPLNSVGFFTAESFYSESLPDPGYPIYDKIPDGCLSKALAYLAGNPDSTLARITDKGFGPLFPASGIKLRAVTAHRIAETLCGEHRAERRSTEVDGPCGTRGLQTLFRAAAIPDKKDAAGA